MTVARFWERSWRYDARVRIVADRHYSRLRPGAPGFVGSGRPLVLRSLDGSAVWVSLWQPRPTHAWPESWANVLFRNEGATRASDLIREAVAITRHEWGEPLRDGFVTFIDPAKVRPKRTPGHCYVIAGWREAGVTTRGLLVMRLDPTAFGEPVRPREAQCNLFENWLTDRTAEE